MMTKMPTHPQLAEIRELLREIGQVPRCVRDPDAERLFLFRALCPDDPEIAALINEKEQVAAILRAICATPFWDSSPTDPSQLPGSIFLGRTIPYGLPWMLAPEDLLSHLLEIGRSGGGKTTLIILLVAQLLEQQYSVKIFDRKGDYACLCHYPQFTYLFPGDIETNWLEPPPGLSFEKWVPILSELLGNVVDIRFAAEGYFTRHCLDAKADSLRKGITVDPTLRDVISRIEMDRVPALSNLGRYRDTVLHRLRSLIDVLGDAICSRRRLNWESYANTPWAVNVMELPTDFQNLYTLLTIAKLLLYRMLNNRRTSRLNDLMVFDEAQTMFKRQYEKTEGNYLLLEYLAQAREFGIGFLIGTQSLANLADTVLANTATKVLIGGSGLGEDYRIFASSTALNQEQVDFLKRNQRPGFACVKDPRYPDAFTVEVPNIVQ